LLWSSLRKIWDAQGLVPFGLRDDAPMSSFSQERRIQIWDGARHFLASVVQPLGDSFAMMVLIQVFEGDVLQKTTLGSCAGLGLLAGAPLLRLLRSSRQSPSQLLAKILMLSGLCVLLSSFVGSGWAFVALMALATVLPTAATSLGTEIYAKFKKKQRGKRFLTSVLSANLGVLAFASLGSYILEHFDAPRVLLMIFGVALLLSAYCAAQIPSSFQKRHFQHLSQLFTTLRNDRLFAYMCLAWFVLGMANLWLFPYRTNYLLEPDLGPALEPQQVVLLVVMVPELLRLLSSPLFAWLFDRINFILLRMVINIFFALYALFFFGSQGFWGLLVGAIFLGIAQGGGSFAWQLWVTKIAPAEKAPTYMLIHTTLTGLRRFCCPAIGLWALHNWGSQNCGLVSAILILLATLMFLPLLKMAGRFQH
jgi:MFS family permease